MYRSSQILCLFFFNDTATTEIYTLSLHDALPIFFTVPMATLIGVLLGLGRMSADSEIIALTSLGIGRRRILRSEEHTSELQSRLHLVCRLLLEKKKL